MRRFENPLETIFDKYVYEWLSSEKQQVWFIYSAQNVEQKMVTKLDNKHNFPVDDDRFVESGL